MSNKYRFYNFFDQIQELNGMPTSVVKGFHLLFETDTDRPLRAYNLFRKELLEFDFLVENDDVFLLYGVDGQFYKVDFETIKEHYLSKHYKHAILMTEAAFVNSFKL